MLPGNLVIDIQVTCLKRKGSSFLPLFPFLPSPVTTPTSSARSPRPVEKESTILSGLENSRDRGA